MRRAKAGAENRQGAETSYKKAKFTTSGAKRKQTHRIAENRRTQARRDAR